LKEEEIFVRWYDIAGWILDRVEKFPRSQRFVFGQRITNLAIDRCQKFLRKSRYVLKCDIVSYFPSIDHEILLGIMASG
jgi:hypothetical protein